MKRSSKKENFQSKDLLNYKSKKLNNNDYSYTNNNIQYSYQYSYQTGLVPFTISILLSIIILVININASIWINKLEKINCACSESYMRSYIKYFLYIFIPISLFNILFHIYAYINAINICFKLSKSMFLIYIILSTMYVIYVLTNIVISIIFINKLKELNCECSEDIRREVYWIYNIVIASLICIIFSVVALISIFYGSMFTYKSTYKSL